MSVASEDADTSAWTWATHSPRSEAESLDTVEDLLRRFTLDYEPSYTLKIRNRVGGLIVGGDLTHDPASKTTTSAAVLKPAEGSRLWRRLRVEGDGTISIRSQRIRAWVLCLGLHGSVNALTGATDAGFRLTTKWDAARGTVQAKKRLALGPRAEGRVHYELDYDLPQLAGSISAKGKRPGQPMAGGEPGERGSDRGGLTSAKLLGRSRPSPGPSPGLSPDATAHGGRLIPASSAPGRPRASPARPSHPGPLSVPLSRLRHPGAAGLDPPKVEADAGYVHASIPRVELVLWPNGRPPLRSAAPVAPVPAPASSPAPRGDDGGRRARELQPAKTSPDRLAPLVWRLGFGRPAPPPPPPPPRRGWLAALGLARRPRPQVPAPPPAPADRLRQGILWGAAAAGSRACAASASLRARLGEAERTARLGAERATGAATEASRRARAAATAGLARLPPPPPRIAALAGRACDEVVLVGRGVGLVAERAGEAARSVAHEAALRVAAATEPRKAGPFSR